MGDERRFRPEIEGLRAVAAVLVAVYHVFLGRVSGGVDVFFVIAGFLITTSLVGSITREGAVGAGRFVSRLAVRLLPIAILTLVAVTVATILWMPVTRQAATYGEIAASALYVENWALAIKAVDYLARDAAQSPVQHFWAMSVQGQFYLAWLVLFAVVLRAAGRERFRDAITVMLTVVFAASLAFSIVLTASNQPLAYFHTATRMWEFAAGGLLALLLARVGGAIPGTGRLAVRRLVAVAGWIGLAMIVSCGIVISVSSQFPGYAALYPVVGAVLVVLGAGSGLRWGSDRFLGSRPLVFVGGVAYALYLWHWPILVFYRILRGGSMQVRPLHGVAIIALAFVLAVITTRLVEQPIRLRFAGLARPRAAIGAGAAAIALVAVTAGSLAAVAPSAGRLGPLDPVDHPGAAALRPGHGPQGGDVPFAPDLELVARDLTGLHGGCQQAIDRPELILCERGALDGDVTVLLAGGSHATHWFPALDDIARDRGWRLVSATKAGCRLTDGPFGTTDQGRSCAAWNAAVEAHILGTRPGLIITNSTATTPTSERVPAGYVTFWQRIAEAGIPILGIRDTPRSKVDQPDCLALHRDAPEACDLPRSGSLEPVDPATLVEGRPDSLHLVDMTDYLCVDDTCPAVIGNVVVYRDRHHLSASYARTLTPMLAERIPVDIVTRDDP